MPSLDRRALALVLLGLSLACASVGARHLPELGQDERFFVGGYHAYWTGDAWHNVPLSLFDEVYFFELEATADGGLDPHGWPSEWTALVVAAESAGAAVTPTVSMHDPDGFQQLFESDERIESLIASVTGLIDDMPDIAGVHLDFEVFQTVSPASRDGFTAFVSGLRGAIDARYPEKGLSLFSLAFDVDDVFDEEALIPLVDYVVLQGYDYHSPGSATAGPTAPMTGWGRLNWGEVVRRFEAFGLDRDRMVMSVPFFGYEWEVTGGELGSATTGLGTTLPYALAADSSAVSALGRTREHEARRDAASGSLWYSFRDGSQWRQGWFDDAESLSARYAWVREAGLRGVAIFPIAYGAPELWEGLEKATRGGS